MIDPKDLAIEAFRQGQAIIGHRLPPDHGMPFSIIARKYLRIRTVDGRVVPFELRPIQKRYRAMKRLSRIRGRAARYLLLKYRRGGFTTLEQGESYYMSSRQRNVSVLTLAQDGETTARIFRIARMMHERDPQAPAIKGPGNQYRLEFPGINSMFYIGTAAGRGVGRGDTLSRVHWSEVAWSCQGYNQEIKQRDILTGLSEAASHGEMVLETTPNGSEYFRELYVGAKEGKNEWTAIFFRWFDDATNFLPIRDEEEIAEIMDTLDEEEARLVEAHGLMPEQLKWRRTKKRELRELFYQEYPEDDETCWLISGVPFFDVQTILSLKDYCRQPELVSPISGAMGAEDYGAIPPGAKVMGRGYVVEWAPPEDGVEYVLGADCSEGLVGCDRNGVGVMRRDTGEQVAAAHGLFSVREQADRCIELHLRYNRALIGVERENHGHAVIQRIIDQGFGEPHVTGGPLFYYSMNHQQSGGFDESTARAGWSTNVVTRPVMLEALRDWMEAPDADLRINDRAFISECMTFRMQANGKFSHDPACHDDTIMKWAIANQMRLVEQIRPQVFIV